MKVSGKSLFSMAVASLALAGVTGAQTQLNNIKKVSSINYATYDLKTGEVSRAKAAGAPCWSNTDTSGFFSGPGSAGKVDEWISYGGLATTQDPSGQCVGGIYMPGNSIVGGCNFGVGVPEIISGFTFGYATNELGTAFGGPGVTLATTFYDCAVPGVFAGIPQIGLCFSGLPGVSMCPGPAQGWIISVCLSGGFNFCLDDTKKFGFGLIFYDLAPKLTGPLLCFAGNSLGGADGNCQSDFFDWYAPPAISGGTLLGAFFFGGYPFDFSSWYLQIEEADQANCGVAAAVQINGANINKLQYTDTPLCVGGTGTACVINNLSNQGTLAFLLYTIGPCPSSFVLDLAGIQQEIFLDVFGQPLNNGGFAVFAPAGATAKATFITSAPKDTGLCGLTICVQGLGLGTNLCGPGFRLSNACELTLGS